MKVRLKSPELDAIQYLGDNAKEVMELMDSASLGLSMNGGLLHTSTSTPEKVATGTWLVRDKVVDFVMLSTAKFMMTYQEVV